MSTVNGKFLDPSNVSDMQGRGPGPRSLVADLRNVYPGTWSLSQWYSVHTSIVLLGRTEMPVGISKIEARKVKLDHV